MELARCRSPQTLRQLAIAALLGALGCDDAAPPAPRDVQLDFCSTSVPVFLAVSNDGEPWTSVAADADGTFSFSAAHKVGVVYVEQSGASYTTTFLYVTSDELAALGRTPCVESLGTRTVTGSVAGLASGEVAQVALGADRAIVFAPNTGFTFHEAPAVAADLFALRVRTTPNEPPVAIIARRDVDPADASIATLNLAGGETFAPSLHTLNIANLIAGERNRIDVFFSTSTVTPFPLHSIAAFTSADQSIGLIPESVTRAGDLHTVDVSARTADGSAYRGNRQFFRIASDRTAELGAPLATPAVTQLGVAPRVRISVDRQPTYASLLNVRLDQHSPALHRIVLVVTSGYAGATGSWEVDTPDFATIGGIPAGAGFVGGTDVTWTVEAVDGPAAAVLGAPVDGARLRYAGATGTLSL